MSDDVIAILAGGIGKRLWPLSTADRPKQFVPLFAGKSMLQLTFERAANLVGAGSVYLVGNAQHEDYYRNQLPDLPPERLFLEPEGRGTAAALALAATRFAEMMPGTVVATLPSDHVIPDADEWQAALRTALEFARANDALVCLGAPAKRRQTKFGYMVTGSVLGGTREHPVKAVQRFVEKPDAAALDDLVASGTCVRNMGTLVFRPEVLKAEMTRLAPDTYGPIAAAQGKPGGALQKAYEKIPPGSIDDTVLSRSKRVAVATGQILSADAGDFVSLGDALGRDESGNASVGRVVSVDASDNTVFADDVTVALVGVSGLVVVVEGDHILVCPAGETQRIKEISENS